MRWIIFIVSILLPGAVLAQVDNKLEQGFQSPPPQCRPEVFYQIMGGMISREAFTKDFEAMASAGIGGVLMMQVPDQLAGSIRWPFRDYPGKIKCLSNEWFDAFNYAIGETDRLGLTFSSFPCPGWSHVGGPWVPADKSLKVLAAKATQLKGPAHFDGLLARAPVTYEGNPNIEENSVAPKWASDVEAWKKLKESYGDYYRDVAVVAFPDSAGTLKKPLSQDKILDLTTKMDAKGRLQWDVPDGNWTVVRLGCAAFNGSSHPAPVEGAGLECDRMDANAVRLVFDNYVGRMVREARAKGYKSFKGFDTDSYEAGDQDFCLDFPAEFKKRMGYDCIPWLPAFVNLSGTSNPFAPGYIRGKVVGNVDLTGRFRRDMLEVISQLWIERFYAGIRRFADDNRIEWMIEPYCGPAMNWRTVAARAHMPGSEFWVLETMGLAENWIGDLTGPAPDTAALYGKSTVWSEAFSAACYNSAWRNDPWLLKPFGDAAFCRGINHFVMHGFVHNPFGDNIKPGLSFGSWGTQLGRNVTWWPYSSAWHRYIARCQFLLSQGLPVADVLAYPPANNSIEGPVLECAPYKQTVCNDETLLNRLAVKDGRIVLPHGVSYAALAIANKPSAKRGMTPQELKRILDLVKEGATLIGEPIPATSVSMQNYPQCDKEMASLIAEIWGPNIPKQGERKLGKGRVIWGRPLSEVLNEVAGGPDFDCNIPRAVQGRWIPRYDFFHRRTPDAEIYFVANLVDQPLDTTAGFRVTGRKPQLWDPVTGQTRMLPEYSEKNGHTVIPLHFAPRQSFFVIFPRTSDVKDGKSRANFPTVSPVLTIEGPWQVAFDPNWGGPKNIEFASLEDWTKRPEKGIKYYSGTAIYHKTFDVPNSVTKTKTPIYLDLGNVKNLARIRLNGKDMGIIWCAPWRVEIGSVLMAKDNKLEIDVVNTWVNRIIGDEQEPLDCEMVKAGDGPNGGYTPSFYGMGLKDLPDWLIKGEPRPSTGRYTFVNWQFYDKNAPLLESGLIGPVRIMAEE